MCLFFDLLVFTFWHRLYPWAEFPTLSREQPRDPSYQRLVCWPAGEFAGSLRQSLSTRRPDDAVGIAPRVRAGLYSFRILQGQDISSPKTSRRTRRTVWCLIQWLSEFFSEGKAARDLKWPPTSMKSWGLEWVEVFFCCSCLPSWSGQGEFYSAW
jgi:hypothetical protein